MRVTSHFFSLTPLAVSESSILFFVDYKTVIM